MKIATDYRDATKALRLHTGVVIPTFLPRTPARDGSRKLLQATLCGFIEEVGAAAHVCLSVDGREFGADEAGDLARDTGASAVISEANRGKLQPIQAGVRELLKNPDLHWFAVVDQDGDHFANELLNFIRAGRHIVDQTGNDKVHINGRRISLHRPMGFLRGELESFVDGITHDALTYDAARRGYPLRMEYATAFGEIPDYHSGYKVYSRALAEAIFSNPFDYPELPADCYWRHSVEVVMVVESILAGGLLGQVNRSTFNEQPVTTFGAYNRVKLYADNIIWPCVRLGCPPAFVEQWMRNRAAQLNLNTLVPQGRDELHQIMAAVRSHVAIPDDSPSGEVPFV